MESLERRRLMATDVSGMITSDTVWSSDINLTGDVRVRDGARLTIQSGVTLTASSPIFELFISDDSSGASLNATGALFNVQIIFGDSADGIVSGNTFGTAFSILGSDASSLSFSGNTINANPRVHAEFVPRLSANSFDTESTVFTFGVIDQDSPSDFGTTWPLIPNVTAYRLDNDVFVREGVFFRAADGVTLSSASPLHDLFVSDDDSGASLLANDVTFQIDQVVLDETATGSVTSSTVAGMFFISGSESSTFDFSDNTIVAIPSVHAEYVPRLAANTFAPSSIVEVFGTVDSDTSWPSLPNVQQYRMVNDVIVGAASTLTLNSGVTIVSASPLHDMFISSDKTGATLIADGVTFLADQVVIDETATGRITNSTISSFLTIAGANASTFEMTGNTINTTPSVHAEYAPRLSANTFAAASTIEVFGIVDEDTAWPNIPNVALYRLIDDVSVRGASVLTIHSGNAVSSQSTQQDLFVSDDNSGASLIASGVHFQIDEVVIDVSASGNVSASTIAGAFVIQGTETSMFQFRNNSINTAPRVHAEYVPRLATNTFIGTSTVDVFGQADGAVVWPKLPGQSIYRLIEDVHVTGTGSLKIESGVQLARSNNQYVLFVGDPASLAKLEMSGVTVSASVIVFDSSTIKSRFSTFTASSLLTVNSGATVDVHFNDFSAALEGSIVAEGDPSTSIDLTQNWWGTLDPAEIELKIVHQVDAPNRPLVIYTPFLLHPLRIPDYVPTMLTVVSTGPLIAGGLIDVSYAISNLSLTGDGEHQSAALFYLNSGANQNGAALLDFVAVEPLGIETATGSRSTRLALPGPEHAVWSVGLPGTYTLSMLVDASNSVMEFVESNNTISTTLDVSPQVLTISESGGETTVSEDGTTDEISIALASTPNAQVIVNAIPDVQIDLGAGAGNAVAFSFQPAEALTPQTLTVAAADDLIIEGQHLGQISFTLSSTDPNFQFGFIAKTTVVVGDNDSVKVQEIRINGSDDQRSSIDQIEVVFNTAVDVLTSGVELYNQQTGEAIPAEFGNGEIIGGRSVLPVVFDPSRISDGHYQIRILSQAVTSGGIPLDGDANGLAGENHVDKFFRFFGDTDGDGDVDLQDYGRFGATFLKRDGQPEFNPSLDFDRDGDVDGNDYARFRHQLLDRLSASG